MKKIVLIFVIMASVATAIAQVPQGINYQAVARDASGAVYDGQNGTVRISILDTIGGTVLYKEEHQITTNQFGLFTLTIGKGSALQGTFSNISWGLGSKFLQVEADFGNGMEDMGTTQLLSVPYALFAKEAANGQPGKNSVIRVDTIAPGLACMYGGIKVLYGLDDNGNGLLDNSEVDGSRNICRLSPGNGGGSIDTVYVVGDSLYVIDVNGNVNTSSIDDNDWITAGPALITALPGKRVGIGVGSPVHQLDVKNVTGDSIIATFSGTNAIHNAMVINSTLSGGGTADLTLLSNGVTAVLGVSPNDNTAYLYSNNSVVLSAPYIRTVGNISSLNPTVFDNYGLIQTDSFRIFGGAFNNILVNDGTGKAIWTNPASLGLGSLWSQSTNGSDIYFNTGNVGIGTNAPNVHLEIFGNETSTTPAINGGSSSTTLRIHNDNLTNNNFSAISFSTQASNNGIVEMGKIVVQNMSHNVNSLQGDIVFFARGFNGGTNNLYERMRITSGGNIGIGTPSPTAKLHLNGTLRLDSLGGSIGAGDVLTAIDAQGNAQWKPRQIAFEAYLIYDTTVIWNGGYQDSIIFSGVSFNDTSNMPGGFNTTTGAFTAPVSGVYNFDISLNVYNVDTMAWIDDQIKAELTINGNVVKTKFLSIAPRERNSLDMDITFKLNQGDVISVFISSGTASKIILKPTGSWFSGHLIYAY